MVVSRWCHRTAPSAFHPGASKGHSELRVVMLRALTHLREGEHAGASRPGRHMVQDRLLLLMCHLLPLRLLL